MKNFGRIKTAFNDLLANSVGRKKDNKNKIIFKDYVKAIRESEILKSQFLVYSNIENMTDDCPSSAVNFISENVNALRKYKPEDIIAENKKLIALSESISRKLNEPYELYAMHESLSNLICTERTPRNLTDLSNDLKVVVNYAKNNKEKTISESSELPQSLLLNIVVDKFNDKYDSLDESSKLAVKSVIDSTSEEKNTIYKKLIRESIDLIDMKLIDTTDLISKEKLLKVKDKLLRDNDEIINENEYISSISKIVELKNGLKTN